MKLQQLRAFHELMLCGSVSEAARNLHRSQSAVSAMISNLEAEFGMALFERRGGRLHPVPEAHYVQRECAELLRRIESMRRNVTRLQDGSAGELHLASMPGPAISVLPQLVARFARDRPDVRVTLISRSSDAVAELVAAQRFDVGIADYRDEGEGITTLVGTERFDFECLCAVPASSPVASLETVTPADLADHDIASLYPEHATACSTAACFADADRPWRPRFVAQYFVPLLTWVEAGLAAAIVDPLTVTGYRQAHPDGGGVAFRRFAPAVTHRIVMLLPAHRPASRTAAAFTELIRDEFRRGGARTS